MNLMQLPDEYQNDSQGRDKWHRSHNNHKEEENKNYEEEAKQLIEKIFSVNSYFYHSCSYLNSRLAINSYFEKEKLSSSEIRTCFRIYFQRFICTELERDDIDSKIILSVPQEIKIHIRRK